MDMPIVKNTNFTVHFVLDKLSLSKHLKSEPPLNAEQLENFEIKQISDESNFMSTIYRFQFSWKMPFPTAGCNNAWPTSVILKVPGVKYYEIIGKDNAAPNTSEEDASREFINLYLTSAHKREIAFYNCFHQFDPSIEFLPKLFYGADYSTQHCEGLIIMEDLSGRAVSLPVLPGLNDAHVRAVLEAMARVHATAWAHPSEWQQMVLADYDDNGTPTYWALEPFFISSVTDGGKEIAKIEPNAIGPLIHRLLPIYRKDFIAMSYYDGIKYGFPSCMVHSDLWSPNILWTKNADGQASENLCAIIDWQTVHAGNPCEDICRLLALNTSGDYRRANTDRLLAFYAEKVAHFMGGTAPFTMAQLKQAYTGAMPYTMMFLCFGASMYCTMDSIVGTEPAEREMQRMELFQRVQMFLEDTEAEFRDQLN
ncbi:hypothetical protein GPALN_010721 [Globodera pallida]|nr:hypothetical protein GPALN_010721 [Globodera pallida]